MPGVGVKEVGSRMRIQEQRLIDILQAKRRMDPDGFSKYLPGVAELLPEPLPERAKPFPFGLTGRELDFHRDGLRKMLDKLGEGAMTPEEAVAGLRHCAALIRDDNLPDEAGYHALTGLVKAATGKSPGSYKSKTTVPIDDGGSPVLERVPAIRGVYLELDRDRRLVSISVHPGKVKERRRLMEIVGMGQDPQSDVASKHDDYLAMQEPHGDA